MNRLMKVRRIGVAAVICAGILSVSLMSGCGKATVDPKAQVEALEITPDNFEQCRQQLVAWANEGNIYAASKMCDLGLFLSMREVDPQNLEKWKDDPLKIGTRTARQVYAVVYSNHTYNARPREFPELCMSLVEIIKKDPVEDYMVMTELVWMEQMLAPDRDSSRELNELYDLLEAQKPGPSENIQLARWNLVPMSVDPYGYERDDALEKVAIAARICRKYGCKEGLAYALQGQGLLSQPDINPEGDWERALAFYEESLELYRELDLVEGEAFALFGKALCSQPDHYAEGQWSRSLEMYDESIRLFEQVDRPQVLLLPLSAKINALRPDVNPDGDWGEATDLCEDAIMRYRALEGYDSAVGNLLGLLASCTWPDRNPNGNWLQAAELYAEAAQIFREIGDEEGVDFYKESAKYCAERALGL